MIFRPINPGTITNMLTLVNQKLISGNYGILEEESGLTLLEKNYNSSIKNFIPLKYMVSNGQHINFIPPGSYTINMSGILKNPSIITSSLFRKALYFILITLPVLFSSFFVPEAILILPYAGLLFAHNYFPYFQPIFYQYPALVAPGIFISGAVFMGKYEKSNFHGLNMKRFATVALAVAIITWFLFTPYGNLITDNNNGMHGANYLVMGNYETYSHIHYTTYDQELQNMINSIPKGSSVAIQNNMPQLVQFYNYAVAMNGYNGSPQYIITDPYPFESISSNSGGDVTAAKLNT